MKLANDEVRIPMDIPRTYRVVDVQHVTSPSNIDPQVHPFMVPLIMALSAKNPTWEFSSHTRRISVNGNPTNTNYADFMVWDGDQTLGSISKSWKGYSDVYSFDNHRLSNERKRGTATMTKDLNKAVKTICNSFYTLTASEQLDRARNKTHASVLSGTNSLSHKFRNEWNKAAMPIVDYVFANWKRIVPHLPVRTDNTYSLMPELYKSHMEMALLSDAWRQNNGAVVAIFRDKYLVSYLWEDKSVHHTFTSDTLPTNIKQAVGMLKLLPIDDYVADVGVRATSDTFFVVLDKGAA